MGYVLKAGDHVSWNSEAGHVQGTIKTKVTFAIKFKTYIVHASKEEPQSPRSANAHAYPGRGRTPRMNNA